MNGFGELVLYSAGILLGGIALARGDHSFSMGLKRALEQSLILLPRVILAFIAATFIVKLIPTEIIVGHLGAGAGFTAILIASVTGLLVPAGPAVAFAVAATFALEGASVPALIAFLTGWSVFAAHRVLIFEIPLLGARFVRLRMLCVIPLPLIAGALAMIATGQ